MLVVVVHWGPLFPDIIAGGLRTGMAGVSFFYLLSGFVLAWTARSNDTKSRFYLRRFARVYPLHVVTWIVAVLLIGLSAYEHHTSVREGLAALLLVQSWVPDLDYVFAANTVSWSLSCELLFYAAFPLIFPSIARLGRRGWHRLVASCSVAMLIINVIAWRVGGDVGLWLANYLPPVRMLEFVIGICLALYVQDGVRLQGRIYHVAAAAMLALAVGALLPSKFGLNVITLAPFALLILAAASEDLDGGRVAIWLRSPWLVSLGAWSFGLYLLHQMLFEVAHEALGQPSLPAALAACFALTALAVVLSSLLYRFYEAPIEKRLRALGVRLERSAAHVGCERCGVSGSAESAHRVPCDQMDRAKWLA